jgi:hypothetical protein
MGELDAVGDAVTGGVIGRAVEPKSGEAPDGHTHETNCLNCGAALAGPFCHECGQHAHIHRTLHAFFHDFLHGVLHFEGKIWRTLPLLAWKPGELTRRYIDGQRTSFISPIALFLFCVFLTFAVMGLTGGTFSSMPAEGSKDPNVKLQAFNAEGMRDRNVKFRTIDLRAEGVPDWLRQGVEKARKNPELLLYKIKTSAYKFSWALIPISVPFVWLLFPFNRGFRLYDHTIFVTYSLCFMMLLLIASTLIGVLFSSIANLAWLIPPAHMYRQLRGTYGTSRRGAAWRTAALTIFAFIAIALFAILLIALGAFD